MALNDILQEELKEFISETLTGRTDVYFVTMLQVRTLYSVNKENATLLMTGRDPGYVVSVDQKSYR
jgi:hypothetical protein